MNDALKLGQQIRGTSTRGVYTVIEKLGEGGQGEVYRVASGEEQLAVKWYHYELLHKDIELRTRLHRLIQSGPPSDRFTWPIEMAEAPGSPSFGYLMRVVPKEYRSLNAILWRDVEPTFRAITTMGVELADSFLALHLGFCYRDISPANVFTDPETGRILIIDNDNVDVNNSSHSLSGTPRFMAPEVVLGANTSVDADRYSLANLLFHLLCLHHPLVGSRTEQISTLDDPDDRRAYGSEALFIYHPEDASNRPDPEKHPNAVIYWPLYPQLLRDLFVQSFAEGLRNPQVRVRESVWRSAMIQARDSLFYCQECPSENFFDIDARPGDTRFCWGCEEPLRPPHRLKLDRSLVMLNRDARLFPHHILQGRPNDFGVPAAEVCENPREPGVLGLRNLTNQEWVASSREGGSSRVPPGNAVRLEVGLRIRFPRGEGLVLE